MRTDVLTILAVYEGSFFTVEAGVRGGIGQSFGAAILSVRLSFLRRTPRKGKGDSKSCILRLT